MKLKPITNELSVMKKNVPYLILFKLTGNCEFNAMSELRDLKSRIEELESELRERDDEVKMLKEQSLQAAHTNQMANGADGGGDGGGDNAAHKVRTLHID
jgi:predicted RNase H-like nuclease (RuvC/YqgF family)